MPPTASVTLDVAKGQAAKSTSSSDLAHSAEHAVDGNPATYWASDLMGEDADAAVSWQVSFPRSRLNSVDIEWEYAPQQFDLQISRDGDSWKTAYSVSSNPLNSERSHIRLDGIEAQAARLVFGSNAALAHHVGIRHFRVTSISVPGACWFKVSFLSHFHCISEHLRVLIMQGAGAGALYWTQHGAG